MTTDERITAYRSAAAKLAEALAEGDQERAYLATVNALVPLDDGGEQAANAYRGVAWCSDWAAYRANPRGWRWITAAARLRLLAEALILEQPHWCAVCGVQLDQAAVREGNDGAVLCPEHIGTLA